MAGIPNFLGILGIIPVAMLLTASFFVLFTASKSESRLLKKFAYFVTAFLWFAAVVILLTGIYTLMNLKPMMGQPLHPGMQQQRMMPR